MQMDLFGVKGFRENELFDDIVPHIKNRFFLYHEENPHVLDLFLKYSRQVRTAGFKRYSTRAIIERIRWHLTVETKGDQFKINDHYQPCYARLLIVLFPKEFEDFFELRSPQKRNEVYKELNYHGEAR